jgi:hypothetical protein
MRYRLIALLLTAGPVGFADEPLQAPTEGGLAQLVAQADQRREAQLGEVRSSRRYTLRNARWKSDAVMEVEFTTVGQSKKDYRILSTNAAGLQKKVFQKLLDGEVKTVLDKEDKGWITPENYDLKPVGTESIEGRPCRWVELIPKRKSKFIMEGRACIDLQDHALVRLVGRPVKSLSFWVGKPHIVQEFQKHGPFWLYSRLKSTANVRLLGKTELTIDYLDYSVTPTATSLLRTCSSPACPDSPMRE